MLLHYLAKRWITNCILSFEWCFTALLDLRQSWFNLFSPVNHNSYSCGGKSPKSCSQWTEGLDGHQPQLSRKKVERFRLQQLDCDECKVHHCNVLLKGRILLSLTIIIAFNSIKHVAETLATLSINLTAGFVNNSSSCFWCTDWHCNKLAKHLAYGQHFAQCHTSFRHFCARSWSFWQSRVVRLWPGCILINFVCFRQSRMHHAGEKCNFQLMCFSS